MDPEPTEGGGVGEQPDLQAGEQEPLTDPESYGPTELFKQDVALTEEGPSSPEVQEPPGAVVQQDEVEDPVEEDLSPTSRMVEQNQRGSISRRSTNLGGDETDTASMSGVDFFSTIGRGTSAGSMERLSTPYREQQLYASGYRPSSSETAAQIDGFLDDFEATPRTLEDVPEVEEGHSSMDNPPCETHADSCSEPVADVSSSEAQLVRQQLEATNLHLQRKLRQVLDQRQPAQKPVAGTNPCAGRGQASSDTRYKASLLTWRQLVEEVDKTRERYSAQCAELQAGLLEANSQADSMRAAFLTFVGQVAKSAVNSRTGQPLGAKVMESWLAAEERGESQLRAVRASSIRLRQALARVEQGVAKKEKLADGLHLIDFEQLKIENQTLNEKIEARNIEILALRKKTSQTVAELTHVKEKLHFQEKVTQELQEKMDEVEGALAVKRDELTCLKGRREKMRLAARRAQQTACAITDPLLLNHLRELVERREDLKAEVRELEARHSAVVDSTTEVRARMNAMANTHTGRAMSARRLQSQGSVRTATQGQSPAVASAA